MPEQRMTEHIVTLQEAQVYIESLLTRGGVEHSIRTAQIASQLAERYEEASSYKVQVAGMLHDCAKDFTPEEMRNKIGELGLESSLLQAVPYEVLHGPVGSKMVERDLLVHDEEIIEAIAFHTTGHPHMKPSTKIVFLADFIEWGRNFEDSHRARELAFENLNKAVLFVLSQKIKYLVQNKAFIDVTSILAWNSLIKEHEAQRISSE